MLRTRPSKTPVVAPNDGIVDVSDEFAVEAGFFDGLDPVEPPPAPTTVAPTAQVADGDHEDAHPRRGTDVERGTAPVSERPQGPQPRVTPIPMASGAHPPLEVDDEPEGLGTRLYGALEAVPRRVFVFVAIAAAVGLAFALNIPATIGSTLSAKEPAVQTWKQAPTPHPKAKAKPKTAPAPAASSAGKASPPSASSKPKRAAKRRSARRVKKAAPARSTVPVYRAPAPVVVPAPVAPSVPSYRAPADPKGRSAASREFGL